MELLEGRSLGELLAAEPRLAPRRALDITGQVLAGLEAAHTSGVIHRDLKPDNVFLAVRPDGSEVVKLVDFGVALLKREHAPRLTTTGHVIGTPLYMAPEQARGARDLDHRIDVHAVGVMLYEMLAGDLPYPGDNPNLVLFAIMNGRPIPLRDVAPAIDQVLA